ncbi:camt-1 family protein [Megaselia abdita]
MAGYRQLPPPIVAHQNRSAMYHNGNLYQTNIHGGPHSQHMNYQHHHLMAAAAAAAAANRQQQQHQQQQQQQQHHNQQHSMLHHPHHAHQQHTHHNNHHHLQIPGNLGGVGHHPAARQLYNHGHMQSNLVPLNANGEPIKLPENLESLPRADHFPSQRHRWNTNEEIAAILISFDKHLEWQSKEVRTRPKSGSLILYSRKKVRYRRDGYCWKKRKDGKTTREDHMKLKVQGTECIYGCYVHSAILPTFHRRCYWLLQNPDIVLVHYLNVPYPDDNKMAVIAPSLSLWGEKKEWTKEELVNQLKPMLSTVFSEDDSDSGNDIEISTSETVESIVGQLMEKQRVARQAALVKQLECGCSDGNCGDGKSCTHPMRRTGSLKGPSVQKRFDNGVQNGQNVGPRIYSRWMDKRNRGDTMNVDTQKQLDSINNTNNSIKFQIISSSHNNNGNLQSNVVNHNAMQHHQQQQQQQQQQPNHHHLNRHHNNSNDHSATQFMNVSTNQIFTNTTNNNNNSNSNNNHPTNNQLSRLGNQILITSTTSYQHHQQQQQHQMQLQRSIESQKSDSSSTQDQLQRSNCMQHQMTINQNGVTCSTSTSSTTSPPAPSSSVAGAPCSSTSSSSSSSSSSTSSSSSSNPIINTNINCMATEDRMVVSGGGVNNGSSTTTPTVALNLSQMHNSGNELQSFMCQTPSQGSSPTSTGTTNSSNNYNYTQQQSTTTATSNTKDRDLNDSLSFFNETLDLSQEDIQKTLIANMPIRGLDDDSVLNQMDFMNNVCDVNGNTSHTHSAPDDVFVNLDAFDMLVELPDLEFVENSFAKAANQISNQQNTGGGGGGECLSISDYSPEWAYTDGGVKVLVTGPWKSTTSSYTVLFDSFPVQTTVVQEGVLRCYCPAHDVGFATLQVACDGFVVSNSVIFEYKSLPNGETVCDGTANDSLYKFTLFNRLSTIEEQMQIKSEPKDSVSDEIAMFSNANFEERLVKYCEALTTKAWRSLTPGAWAVGYKGMTLLHLASALGYSKLVLSMLTWRSENPNVILETEIDAMSQDVKGFTPLSWACIRGHLETAKILYKWNHNSLKIKNKLNQSPVEVARFKGFLNVVNVLDMLESERINKENGNEDKKNLSLTQLLNNKVKKEHEKLEDGKGSLRSHDGVFLRPVPVTSPPTGNGRFAKRSSVDSGINMDIRTRSGKYFKDSLKLQGSYDSSDSFLDGADNSSSLLSPLRKIDFALCEVSTTSPENCLLKQKRSSCDNDSILIDSCNLISSDSKDQVIVGDSDAKVLTLAEHIIAAMPDRIKNESEELMILGSPMSESLTADPSELGDSFMDPIMDTQLDTDFASFDFDNTYRYTDASTPCSSLSPASSGPLQSPASYSLAPEPPMSSPSPPPSAKELTEFLHASSNISSSQSPFEADFSKLTLTDSEQRELYEAAKCIQKAYRSYKGRKKLEEQDKERSAAIVIQNYYRRYKQYAYYRQMTHAALVIQNGYRSYCENKRFKKSQTQMDSSQMGDNTSFQNYYDQFKNEHHMGMSTSLPMKEASPSGPLKRTYSQRTKNQAARKIQQFMRQSKLKLQKERAEKEKLARQRKVEFLQNCPYPEQYVAIPRQGPNENDEL